MVSLDPINFPTAILAVLISFLLQTIKERIKRIRQKQRKEKQNVKNWLDKVITSSRKLQITAMIYEGQLESIRDETPPPAKFDSLDELGEYMDIKPQSSLKRNEWQS